MNQNIQQLHAWQYAQAIEQQCDRLGLLQDEHAQSTNPILYQLVMTQLAALGLMLFTPQEKQLWFNLGKQWTAQISPQFAVKIHNNALRLQQLQQAQTAISGLIMGPQAPQQSQMPNIYNPHASNINRPHTNLPQTPNEHQSQIFGMFSSYIAGIRQFEMPGVYHPHRSEVHQRPMPDVENSHISGIHQPQMPGSNSPQIPGNMNQSGLPQASPNRPTQRAFVSIYENLPLENPNDPELQEMRQVLLQMEQIEHQCPAHFQTSSTKSQAKGIRELSVAQKKRIYSVGLQKAAVEDPEICAIFASHGAIFDKEELEAVDGGDGEVGTGGVSLGSS